MREWRFPLPAAPAPSPAPSPAHHRHLQLLPQLLHLLAPVHQLLRVRPVHNVLVGALVLEFPDGGVCETELAFSRRQLRPDALRVRVRQKRCSRCSSD